MAKQTQVSKIIIMLKLGWVSPLDAMRELGCMRFGSRINDIRNLMAENEPELMDYRLEEAWVKTTNRFGDKVSYKKFRLVHQCPFG